MINRFFFLFYGILLNCIKLVQLYSRIAFINLYLQQICLNLLVFFKLFYTIQPFCFLIFSKSG